MRALCARCCLDVKEFSVHPVVYVIPITGITGCTDYDSNINGESSA